jgi:hypothetical protein
MKPVRIKAPIRLPVIIFYKNARFYIPSSMTLTIFATCMQKVHSEKGCVALLRYICVFFELEVDGLSQSRKDPYIALISKLVQGCTCGGKSDN